MAKYVCYLTISGPKQSREEFAKRAVGMALKYAGERWYPVLGQKLCFNSLVPVPDALVARPYTRRSRPGVEDSGRDWELKHWGCPRGATNSRKGEGKDQLTYTLFVKVAPPIPFIRAVSVVFPTLEFRCFSLNYQTCETLEFGFRRGKSL